MDREGERRKKGKEAMFKAKEEEEQTHTHIQCDVIC